VIPAQRSTELQQLKWTGAVYNFHIVCVANVKVKVKQSNYRPGEALRVPGG